MSIRRKDPPWHKIILLTLALLAASTWPAWAWPEQWQPGDKPYVVAKRGIFTAYSTEESYPLEIRVYEGDEVVILIAGRPILVDAHPGDPCAPLLMDKAIYGNPGPDDMKPRAAWPAAEDWQPESKRDLRCKEA